jgi:hypothetical protein
MACEIEDPRERKKKGGLGGHKHTKPPQNCNHKYNIFAIFFFGNV